MWGSFYDVMRPRDGCSVSYLLPHPLLTVHAILAGTSWPCLRCVTRRFRAMMRGCEQMARRGV